MIRDIRNDKRSTSTLTTETRTMNSSPKRRKSGRRRVATAWPENFTLPETLYLLCSSHESGCPGMLEYLDHTPMLNRVGTQAAAVAELVLAGRVTLRLENGEPDKIWTDRVWARVINGDPLGDAILDAALARLISLGGYSEPINLAGRALVRLFGRQTCSWELVPKQLVMKGILRQEHFWVWGIFLTTRFPLVDTDKRDDLRRTFTAALRSTGQLPDRLAALVSIAQSGCSIDRALTDDLSPFRTKVAIRRAERNKLGCMLARMIDVATYVHPESQYSGLLAS